MASLRFLWNGEGAEADAFRRRVRNLHSDHTTTYNHLNINFGFTYAAAALVPDGASPPPSPDPIQLYQPSTRPGCSLPHVLFEDLHQRIPLGDLLGRNRFVLLTGEIGEVWRDGPTGPPPSTASQWTSP